jgi:hypothetical protein
MGIIPFLAVQRSVHQCALSHQSSETTMNHTDRDHCYKAIASWEDTGLSHVLVFNGDSNKFHQFLTHEAGSLIEVVELPVREIAVSFVVGMPVTATEAAAMNHLHKCLIGHPLEMRSAALSMNWAWVPDTNSRQRAPIAHLN